MNYGLILMITEIFMYNKQKFIKKINTTIYGTSIKNEVYKHGEKKVKINLFV